MKKILITGANSYIGTNVERWLLREPEKYTVETLDMKDEKWNQFDFSGYDVVFHVAGIAHIKETKKNKDLYYKVNRDLAIETALKAKESKVKQFIFLSTMSVYGKETGVITKETIPNPKTTYGKSKYEAELKIRSLSTNDFITTILRPPMIYGDNSPGNYQRLRRFALKILFYPKVYNKRSMLDVNKLSEYVDEYIMKEKDGIFFPQDNEYGNTTKIMDEARIESGKKSRAVRFIAPFVFILYPFSKSIRKIFGTLIYEEKQK